VVGGPVRHTLALPEDVRASCCARRGPQAPSRAIRRRHS
jgi:hypothetical protein